MASARATVTLQESSDGGVYVLVQTREPLGPYKLLGRQWQPEQYLNQQVDPGSVQLMCSLEVDSGLWLPQLRASTPFWSVERYLDITAQSAERGLLETMIAQEDFEVVWANEGIQARRPVHERTRKLLQETFAGFSELDAATWKEAVAESEWRASENWRPGPHPGKARRRTARPTTDVELRYFAMRTGALPREGAARVADFKPCNRPADALTAVGFGGVQLRSEQLSAILRSSEERLGAVVTLLDPGRTLLSVEAPPRTFPSALGVAAEHFAVAPKEDAGRPGALAEQARILQGAPIWDLSWRG